MGLQAGVWERAGRGKGEGRGKRLPPLKRLSLRPFSAAPAAPVLVLIDGWEVTHCMLSLPHSCPQFLLRNRTCPLLQPPASQLAALSLPHHTHTSGCGPLLPDPCPITHIWPWPPAARSLPLPSHTYLPPHFAMFFPTPLALSASITARPTPTALAPQAPTITITIIIFIPTSPTHIHTYTPLHLMPPSYPPPTPHPPMFRPPSTCPPPPPSPIAASYLRT